jgi:putative DNA primase/helicase
MTTYEILSFQNRYSSVGVVQKLSYEQMFKAFKNNVIRTKETVLEYQKGDKNFKLKCKDKGGFIAGTSENNKRDSRSILTRNMITLDMDYCPKDIIDILEKKLEEKELNFLFFIYSTHSHTTEKPRLRLIVPLREEVKVELYEPIARSIASIVGIEYFDATTFQINRIMYFPSVSIDGDYVCQSFGFEDWFPLEPDEMLDRYLDFHNIAEFQKPHYIEGLKVEKIEKGKIKSSTKTKYRIVNSFNTEYSIKKAIETFLKDIYVKGKHIDRYTFVGGESKDGLVILNEQYAYSHHATDPAQGRLLNAFDIVRIHKFGKQDTDITEQLEYENYNKNTSFKAMADYIRGNLPSVMKHMPEYQKLKKNEKEFMSGEVETEEGSVESKDWKLTLDYTGKEEDRHPKSNARNIKLIFEHDEYFKNLFYYDSLKDAICFDRRPPWNKEKEKGDMVTDEDDSEIRIYLNTVYQISGKDLIYDSVVHQSGKKRIHPIRTFLANLPEWDGEKRIETIITDIFDIESNQYYREASKAWWVGIIQRIMKPGSKFDSMLIICGRQGIGKSQLGKSIATLNWGGDMTQIDSHPNYFGDDELPFDKKDAYEQLGGIMIYELPEFEKYYKKSDTSTIKSFISKTSDKYRKSYGRRVAEYKRQCVFIATTNDMRPLRDRTGNRRFFPFYSRLLENVARLYDPNYWNEEIRNQCFAEALQLFDEGFNPMTSFSPKAKEIWDELNEKATIENDSLPIVEMYLENEFPINYFSLDFYSMKKFYHQNVKFDFDGNPINRGKRSEFSIKEIYCIAFNREISHTPDYIMREQIESALDKLGFTKQAYRKTQGVLGQQIVYKRTKPIDSRMEGEKDDLPF